MAGDLFVADRQPSRGPVRVMLAWAASLPLWVLTPMALDGDYALIREAAKGGHEGEVARLLDRDSTLLGVPEHDPEKMNPGEEPDPPLLVAAEHGHLGVVKVLMQHGADANATGSSEDTALHRAATRGHEGVVTFLLDNGAAADSRDYDQATPLMCAAMRGHMGMAQMLLERTGPEALLEFNSWDHRALDHAARGGHEEMLAFLLRAMDEANCPVQCKLDALLSACKCDQVGTVRMLLEEVGWEEGLVSRDTEGDTALLCAAMTDSVEVATFLLEGGADCTVRNDEGKTPLMQALFYYKVPAMMLLLKHTGGQGLHDRHEGGETMLHMACRWGSGEMVRALLLAGANHYLTDDAGTLPFDVVVGNGCAAVAIQWWEGELERRSLLCRARLHHDVSLSQQATPLPASLAARVAAGRGLPRVEVVPLQPQEAEEQADSSGERKAEERLHDVLAYAVQELKEDLFVEMMQGLHA